jgi:hypothetical protein
MDAIACRQHHEPVHVTCPCGASRHIDPEALARLVGRKVTLAALATRMRCSQCGNKVAEVVAVARPRPRGRGTVAAQVSHARRSGPGGKRLQITRRSVMSAARRIASSSMYTA